MRQVRARVYLDDHGNGVRGFEGVTLGLTTLERLEGWSGGFSSVDLYFLGAVIGQDRGDHFDES